MVKYVIEIMGYVDFVVHQLIIENKIMCFAVLWLLEPRRSYCTSAAGLVWQLASCFYGVAEGRIFQFRMFSMASVFNVILMAPYMSSGSSGASEGLSAASRILKPPDTFSGDDPMTFASWRFQFTSWLTFGDSRYATMLERVECLTAPPALSTYDDGQKELARKLYAVLTSYLRGRWPHIIKAFAKSRDGFAIWYQLMKEFEPTSRHEVWH